MIEHPRNTVPPSQLQQAYDALLFTLAKDDPEALQRAASTLRDSAFASAENPASLLAHSYLACAGNDTDGEADAGQTYNFNHPGHIHFEVRAGSKPAALRLAAEAVAALLSSDSPLGALSGPFPGQPSIRNVQFWVGLPDGDDELDLESITP